MELKALIPLLGVLVGWFLSEASVLMRSTREERTITNRVVAALLFLRHRSQRASFLIIGAQKFHGDGFSEKVRQHYLDTHMRPVTKDQYKELIADLSGVSPLLAIDVQEIVYSHIALFVQKMENLEKLSPEFWEANVEVFNEAYTASAKGLEKAILSLAWKLGVSDYVKYKWHFLWEDRKPKDWGDQASPAKSIIDEIIKDKEATKEV
jgi:hypothetical protein